MKEKLTANRQKVAVIFRANTGIPRPLSSLGEAVPVRFLVQPLCGPHWRWVQVVQWAPMVVAVAWRAEEREEEER